MKIKSLLLILLTVFVAASLKGQEKKANWREMHYLSAEEMYLPVTTDRSFFETDPPEGPVRNVAEFDKMQAVLIRYPFGIPLALIKEMAEDIEVITIVTNASQEQLVISLYESNGVNLDNCSFLHAASDSYWSRDYGPWFVFDGNKQPGIVNFPYNRPRPNDNDIPIYMAEYLDIDLYGMNIFHTGGNYMTDGMGKSSSTDLVWQENPSLSAEDIDSITHSYLGLDNYFVLPDPLAHAIQHIDCWGKFLSPSKVLIGQVPITDNRYEDYEFVADFFANQTSSWGTNYEVVRVYSPGGPPATPYTNSIILNNKVYVPITGNQWDDEALAVYEEEMPGYEIYGFMAGSNAWLNTDAIHCRAKGVADLGMLYINHVPLLGNIGYEESYEISAIFNACSGEDLYPDSVLIKYSFNGGAYQTSNMEQVYGDAWTGSILGVSPMDEISYYIYAADESGRNAKHPFIGEPDPHEFKAIGFAPSDELSFDPDTILFLDYQQMEEGIPLHIINLTNSTVNVTNLTDYGDEFPWYVDELPDLPIVIEANDTTTLLIRCHQLVSMSGELLSDTMYVETEQEVYETLIMIDSDLISAVIAHEDKTEIKVYPNPFTDRLHFDFKVKQNENVQLSIYDLNGRLIFHQTVNCSDGSHSLTWDGADEKGTSIEPGYYFYKLIIGEKIETGKVILSK